MKTNKKEAIEILLNFCHRSGINCREIPVLTHETNFLPEISILDEGDIEFNKKVAIGDLLHEIAHIACFPKKYRHLLKRTNEGSIDFDSIFDRIANEFDPIEILNPKLAYYGELTVGGYSYLLCLHLNLDPKMSYTFYNTNSKLMDDYKKAIKSIKYCLDLKVSNMMLTQLYYGGWIASKTSSELLKLTC